MSARRILLTIPWISRAGMEQQLIHLATGLAGRGDAVTIACIAALIDTEPLLTAGVRIVELGGSGQLARASMVRRVTALARHADLVHCTGWDASAWGRVGAILARRPALVTEHTPGRQTQASLAGRPRGRIIALHNRLLDPLTYATVAVAGPQLELLRSEGVDARKLVTIPNGVPLDRVREASRQGVTRASLGLPRDALVVLHVARFEPQKRQEWTYEAVRALRASLGDVRAVFAGDGDGRETLQRRAEADGADWAHFLGVRGDVPRLLGLSDLAVLPSSAEALPMAMIEALTVGVPQVATDVGDVGPTLRETGGGLVVPATDQAAFESACRSVLGDPAYAAAMRAAASAGAEQFAVETMTDRYSRLFDAAIAGRPAATAFA